MLFDERATSIIGKSAKKLLKQHTKYDIPLEINALVGEKVTVIVKIRPAKSFDNPDEEPCFDVLNIKKRHGKDLITYDFRTSTCFKHKLVIVCQFTTTYTYTAKK